MDALALSLTQNNMTAAASAGADGAMLDADATGFDFAALVALELNNAQASAALLGDSQSRPPAADNPSDAQPGAEAFGPLVGRGLNITQTSSAIREESPSDSLATDDSPDAQPGANALASVAPATLPSTKAIESVTPAAQPSTEAPGSLTPAAQPSTVALASRTTSPENPVAAQTPQYDQTPLPRAPGQASVEQVAAHLRTASESTPAATAPIADEAANIAAHDEALDVAARPASATIDVAEREASGLDRQRLSPVEAMPRPESPANTVLVQPTESRPLAPQPSALLEVAAPVSEPGFADALSRQVVWMVGKDAQVAELRINPPELGPVLVRLTLNGDEATAQFTSAHAEVREAIDNAIARLRESLAQAGIQLGEASVSAESFADQAGKQADAHPSHRQGYRDEQEMSEAAWQGLPSTTIAKRGLVDVFA